MMARIWIWIEARIFEGACILGFLSLFLALLMAYPIQVFITVFVVLLMFLAALLLGILWFLLKRATSYVADLVRTA
jgi:hypothetical protein